MFSGKRLSTTAFLGTSESKLSRAKSDGLWEHLCDDHWLGYGLYFVDGSPSQAAKFAINSLTSEDDTPVILSADIDISLFLDLVNVDHRNFLKEIHRIMIKDKEIFKDSVFSDIYFKIFRKYNGLYNYVDNRVVDRAIFYSEQQLPLYKKSGQIVNGVRYSAKNYRSLYKNSFIGLDSSLIINVRNPNSITSYRIYPYFDT